MSIQAVQRQLEPKVTIGKNKFLCQIDIFGRVLKSYPIDDNVIHVSFDAKQEEGDKFLGLENGELEQKVYDSINEVCQTESELEELLFNIRERWRQGRLSEHVPVLSHNFNAQQDMETRTAASGAPRLPTSPPVLWKDRPPGRGTNPSKFITDIYGPWIRKELTRAWIGNLDPDLYKAYATWIRRHPEDDLGLRTEPRTKLSDRPPVQSVPPTAWVPTASLTPDEQTSRRAYEAEKKRRQRARGRAPS